MSLLDRDAKSLFAAAANRWAGAVRLRPLLIVLVACVGLAAGESPARAEWLSLEPDHYRDGAALWTANAYIATRVWGSDQRYLDPSIYATASTDNMRFATTGEHVFAAGGATFWNETRRLRLDFAAPVSEILLDFAGGQFFADEIGVLEAYASTGLLLERYRTTPRRNGSAETMVVRRASADVAYAIAYTQGTGSFGRLDHLRAFMPSPPTLVTPRQGRVEPDDYPEAAPLWVASPEVELRTWGKDNRYLDPPVFVTANESGLQMGPVARRVFGHGNVPFWNETRKLRMDFASPVSWVSLDFSGGHYFINESGVLEVYAAGDLLLDTFRTSPRGFGQTETMHVERSNRDIAYAIAYTLGDTTQGQLDNLRFSSGGGSQNADLNQDGRVDRLDVVLLLRRYGKHPDAAPADGDLTGDFAVGLADVAALQKQSSPAAGLAAAVPEPPALVSLLFAAAATVPFARRRWALLARGRAAGRDRYTRIGRFGATLRTIAGRSSPCADAHYAKPALTGR